MKEIIPKETRLSPIIYFGVLTDLPWPNLVVFVGMSLIREDHTPHCSLLNPLLSFEVFLKETFKSSERRHGENIGKSGEDLVNLE